MPGAVLKDIICLILEGFLAQCSFLVVRNSKNHCATTEVQRCVGGTRKWGLVQLLCSASTAI